MTLEEAIRILHGAFVLNLDLPRDTVITASKLGIEALKFFKDLEDRGALPPDVKLPGETKE